MSKKRDVAQEANAPKVFHMTKTDRAELNALHFVAQGAKLTAQVAYNAALTTETNFKNKLVEIRASLGITDADGLSVDLENGTITTKKEAND